MKTIKRYLILILVCIILFNFAMIPKQVEAVAITLAGGKVLFLLLLGALGITVASQTDLEGLYGAYDWDSMIVANHINIGDYIKLPDEPPDYDKLLKAIIVGGTGLSVAFSGILEDIKGWFQDLGPTEGENIFENDELDLPSDNSILGEIYNLREVNTLRYGQYFVSFLDNGPEPGGNQDFRQGKIITNIGTENGKLLNYPINITKYPQMLTISMSKNGEYLSYMVHTYSNHSTGNVLFNTIDTGYIPPVNNPISYNVKPNSSIITNTLPTTIPQPDISILPGIQETFTPEGEKKYIYPGTMNNLIEDIKPELTFENLQNLINGQTKPYTLTETQQGIEIDYGTITEIPYSDIDTEPIEDVSQFQGENIGLLKSIVNWLSNINNKITETPQELGELFYNSDNVASIDFTPITNVSISSKFPFSIPWDLKDSVQLLASEGKAPKWEIPIVTETITIDMAEFEEIASIMRVFNTLLFVVALIILTRRLI